MSKKRKKAHPVQAAKPKDDVVWRQSAEEATLASKPRYNGFACGHGAHGPVKYSRARAKQAWKRQMRQEGASRGSFLFSVVVQAVEITLYGPVLSGRVDASALRAPSLCVIL